jgi:glycosyltransferase involved in cell wall biosynthesis
MKMAIKSDVLVVSYDSGGSGHCPAIWANDKVHALESLGKRITLVTSHASDLSSSENVRVLKVPSVSFADFRFEYSKARSNSQASLLLTLFWPVALVLGSIFDLGFRVLAGTLSQGRYSWVLLATPMIIALKLKNPSAVLFATGGASSGPVSAVLASMFSKHKPVVEFQDPFIGSMMEMRTLASRVMLGLERFIVRHSRKIVFVTLQASTDAQERNKSFFGKIEHIYPGSRTFAASNMIPKKSAFKTGIVQILHMGTLYGSRNLNLFFEALDSLYARRKDLKGKVLVSNMGAVILPELPEYLLRKDFQHLEQLEREPAVQRAALADILLLVQHTDERSAETIPYKTYDYLNLNKPILALSNSLELSQIIGETGGFFAQNSSVVAIAESLERAINLCLSGASTAASGPRFHLGEQVSRALNL